jgi:hypothetical protein
MLNLHYLQRVFSILCRLLIGINISGSFRWLTNIAFFKRIFIEWQKFTDIAFNIKGSRELSLLLFFINTKLISIHSQKRDILKNTFCILKYQTYIFKFSVYEKICFLLASRIFVYMYHVRPCFRHTNYRCFFLFIVGFCRAVSFSANVKNS